MREVPGRAALPSDAPAPGDPEVDAVLVHAVLDALPSPTVLLDPDGIIVLTNQIWTVAGEERGNVIPPGADYYAAATAVNGDAEGRALVRSLRALARGACESVAVDREVPNPLDAQQRWYHVQARRVGTRGHVVVTHTDVSARVLAERTSLWQARHDHLTELPNRAHLHELIDAELSRPGPVPLAVLFLDVDGFKDVNDSLGHDVGDDLLRQLAVRLSECTRTGDTVGRLGGDEFVVIGRDCDAAGAGVLAQRFHDAFDTPFVLRGRTARLTASIGVATSDGTDPGVRSTDLVRDADLAMYAAKAGGRNRVEAFTPELRIAAEQKATLAGELLRAIERGELVLHYQPVLQLPSRRCTGVEALVRWQHPERGLLPPCDFLPTAEQHDLMTPLARWVLREATRQAAAWRDAGLALVAGVNINATHFSTGTLVDDVMDALDAAGLDPSQLIVEVTETSVADDPERAVAQCAQLRRRGVEVAIDDFGSGFSSLSQLVTLPTGILKIDRSLVAFPDGRREQTAAAIAAVVALGKACGIRSLAEGVETAEQLELAADLGCSFAQGFHIARPMPADELAAWAARGVPLGGTTVLA
ncbi:putative bifunctional diguanylate cyclase/phosphodiesterase [Blastococcus tunisiensis]|uniref:Diguanylate cyclase (GGDEF) domain-containing protein n=1 Tax=Blastococcus tunisiensis TaxID=1798228 RepID=A0A1I2JEM8_9ACTN|nr:EAL domain-containing protein [Blastococcus sp. DSM 46838]SFF53292.1 diguanylate cyclase (GGDEF) domain-containing protein [Blastococcus sp. DSM 46838]